MSLSKHTKEDQNLLQIFKIIEQNKFEIKKRITDSINESNDDKSYQNFKDELNINDYLIKKNEFKANLLPKLMAIVSENNTRRQTSALLLLEMVLFNDWEKSKSKLSASALKAALIPELTAIYGKTNETEIKQIINNLFLMLFFVIGFDSKKVRKLLLFSNNLIITSTISELNRTDDKQLIRDSLLLFQFCIYYAKGFDEISQILSTLIRFLNNSDISIVIQSCSTLLVFSQKFQESRKALIESNVCKKLLDLWTNNSCEEELIEAIYAITISILPRFNHYKSALLATNTDILSTIETLAKSESALNKTYACDLIKYIALKPLGDKRDNSKEQIGKIIERKTICLINDLLENDYSLDVKSSALNAIFIIAHNSTIEQLKELAEQGCLKALCSQLVSSDDKHLYRTLLALSVFLFQEYKDFLKTEKKRPNPKTSLSEFSKIIRDNAGVERLVQINEERVAKERMDDRYSITDLESFVEEILVSSFGIETRHKKRIPYLPVLMDYPSKIVCNECKNALANTYILDCEHIIYCAKCAADLLLKAYSSEKKCKVEKCEGKVPTGDCPWYLFKSKLFEMYIQIQEEIENKLD